MPSIDETARIAKGARIADHVEIGPYCIVGPSVEIKSGVRLLSHVNLSGVTTVGEGTTIYPFASVGAAPQSLRYKGGATRLVIGANCQIRENVTINTGTEEGGGVTVIGDDCLFMAGAHVAHDCILGSRIVFANNAVAAGHVEIADYAILGGYSGVHQFVRIGESAMIGAHSLVTQDVIPFGFVVGRVGRLSGINVIGMTRRGMSKGDIRTVRLAYKALFEGEGEFADRVEAVNAQFGDSPQVAKVVAFVRPAKRPIMKTKVHQRYSGADDVDE